MLRPLLLFFAMAAALFVPGSHASPAERVVDLTAADGTKLKATLFPAAQPGPGVLLLHQCNRQRKVWDDLARQLATAGINVLTFDQRGYGESEGQPYTKLTPQQRGEIERDKRPGDNETAFQYLISQPGVSRNMIGIGGASCGVTYSVELAQRHPEVKSLVLLSGNTTYGGRQFLRTSAKLPVFLSVADDDEFPPSLQTIEWIYVLVASPEKRFVHYQTGGHGADMFPVHPELPGMIADFYVATLLKTPGRAPALKENPEIPKEIGILETMDQPGGTAKVEKQFNEARQHDAKAELFPEAIVNFMGYEHMQAGDNKGAIEILKLNAAAYPNSANVYDSLSDAYLADGQKDLARQNAKKALEMLTTDTALPEAMRNGIRDSAEQKIKDLDEKKP
jgi:dienelactone hydrolase